MDDDNFEIDAIFEINATPSKVSELENDLDFQTADEVSASIQAESDVINSRIDNEVETLNGSISDVDSKIDNHISNTSNPHEVTKAQVGLGNADNTSDLDKPVSTAQQTALDGKVDKLTTQPTAGTYTKVIINSQGQVTEGETLSESDIPSLHLTKISDVTATASEVNILDGATVTTSELNVLDGITASTTELNYVDGVTSSIQTQIDGKQPTITGGATTITSSDLTTARTLVSNNNGKVAVSNITSSELDALDDITGNIQTQFNNITDLIPSSATTSNQLADKDFVNSSVSTNTANFIGTFTSVSDLNAYSGTVTNNDYAFVINGVITDNGNDWATFVALDAYDKTLLTNFDYAWVINGSNFDLYRFDILNQEWDLRVQNTQKSSVTLNNAYNRYKATVVSNVVTWDFEYTLNNSSFTAEQWLAINSGITATTKVTHTANTAIGSSTQPVYVNSNGETVAISTTIAKSVPSDAKFTDTTYTIATGSANGTISVSINGGTASDVSVKGLGSCAYTSSTDYATSAQGGKADSAIQTVKVNSSALTPDANKAVNITVPTDTGDLTNNAGFITSSALNGYQTTSNLVTSVSSASTDSQYPSAKLFYDTCGDIETLINAL